LARRLLVLPLLAAALAAAPATAAAFTNPQIPGLQVALQARGYYRGPIDGIAGPMTAQAIRSFQRDRGLTQDGLAGPATRRALGRLGRPRFGARQLSAGAIGWDVSVTQFLLGWHGMAPPHLNGNFGPGTLRAVLRFQRWAHLPADGIVGPATRAALLSSGRPAAAVRRRPVPRHHYRVQPGDTLSAVAARYGTSVSALARANKLSPRRFLLVGTRLAVPHAAPRPGIASSHDEVRGALDRWAAHYSVNPHLVRALAWQESGFQTDITSSVGAWGVLQVTPATWSFVETVLIGFEIPRTTDGSARVGVAYLHHLLGLFAGDVRRALAAYYQGPWAVRKRGILPESKQFIANVLALKARM
jgi:peptidoglycan hydrolase-like protein with peptidoglycan-binding domain